MRIGGQKPTVLAQDTELDGQAAQVLGAAMIGHDKVNVALRQGPIERQLLLGGIRGRERGGTRRAMAQDAGIQERFRRERH